LYLDGLAAWSWLKRRADKEGLKASILGKSLGSAVAIHVAAEAAKEDGPVPMPDSLVLDSAFTSMREVVAGNVPVSVRLLIPKLFESLARMPEIRCPTLVVHGAADMLVPLEQGERLFAALTAPKTLRVITGAGHNDLTMSREYHPWILDFIADPAGFILLNDSKFKASL
jgi:fermentation-respiration switch protein FrsA (DUF1100 family)